MTESAPPSIETASTPIQAAPTAIGHVFPEVRPVEQRIGDALDGSPLTAQSLTAILQGPVGEALCCYFQGYPTGSLMTAQSRAMLFILARMLRPRMVAEIGTYLTGGAEVLARALWENADGGILLTTDPYDADRCRALLANWPVELRQRVQFHPMNSMEFLTWFHHQRATLDLVLIDGDHDYEAALFDLQMAARHTRAGGIVVMNDGIQTGPFQAARAFLRANPAWRELGTALADYSEDSPFAGQLASQPGTGFVILQAPDHLSIAETPRSCGQHPTLLSSIDALSFDIAPQITAGKLHYQAILRRFGGGPPHEVRAIGIVPIRCDGPSSTFVLDLPTPLIIEAPESYTHGGFEIELSWQADSGTSPPLALASPPDPRHRT